MIVMPQVHKGRIAKDIYERAQAKNMVLPNFPIYSLEADMGDRVKEEGIDVWDKKENFYKLYEEARTQEDNKTGELRFRDMTDDDAAVKKFFQLEHAVPAFDFNPQENEVTLAFPLYERKGEYCAITLPLEEVGRLLSEEADYLSEASDDLRADAKSNSYQGIPRSMIPEAMEKVDEALSTLYMHTGWEAETRIEFAQNIRSIGADDFIQTIRRSEVDTFLSAKDDFVDGKIDKNIPGEILKNGPAFNPN